MTSIYKARRATILLCSVAVAVLATSAFARPDHHRHREARAPQVTSQSFTDRDVRYPANMSQMPADLRPTRGRGLSRNRIQPMAAPPAIRWLPRRANISGPIPLGAAVFGVALSWTWCSSAPGIQVVAIWPAPIHVTVPALADRKWALSPYWVAAAAVTLASSAVSIRNPIIVSGNHNHTVAEAVYPASRIHAYVLPGG